MFQCIRKWLLGEQSTCPTCRVHALLPDEFPRLRWTLLESMGKAGTRSACGVHALLGHSYFVFTCTSRVCLIDKWQCVMCNVDVFEGHSGNCGGGWGVIFCLSHLIYEENDKLMLLREFSLMACYTWVEFTHSFHRETYMSLSLEPVYLYFYLSGMSSPWGRSETTISALLS